MKQLIIILLLFTSITQGQTTLANKLKITNNTIDTTATRVNVQNASGVINYNSIANFQKEKGYLSTGLLRNGLITINGDPTKYSVTAGIGVITNFSNPDNVTSTIVRFAGTTGKTPSYLTTANITYVAINASGVIVESALPFTPQQNRSLIILGAVIHSNRTTVEVINNISSPSNDSKNQLNDFMNAVGALNVVGNKFTANGTNLILNKTAGTLFKNGSNFANDITNPHQIDQAQTTALTLRYRTQNGTEGSNRITLEPAFYDLNNVLTSVPVNRFSIHTVNIFQEGAVRVQYGQATYATIEDAESAINTRTFNVESNIALQGVKRAYVILRHNATSLQDPSTSKIIEAQKFGGVTSGGTAVTLAQILAALTYTPENLANKQNSLTVDGTGVKYPTVDAVNTGLSGKIGGSGVVSFFPKFSDSKNITQTLLFDSSGNESIGLRYLTNVNTGDVSYGIGKEFSSGNSTFFGWRYNNGSPYGFLETFAGSANLVIHTGGVGRILFGMTTDNGIDKGQFNGTVSAFPATLSNQVVVKSQLDLKANIASPNFTEVPRVPTATAGTNTTQIASTAFVIANTINGNQTISGRKTFNSDNTTAGGISVFNSKNTTSAFGDNAGVYLSNSGTTGLLLETGFGIGILAKSLGAGAALNVESFSSGNGITLKNQGGTGDLLYAELGKVRVTSSGDLRADVFVSNGKIRLKNYTVATLPTGIEGDTAYVTDATSPTYLGALTGGGTVKCPVFFNGTIWVSH